LLLVRRNELTTDAAGSSWELLRDHHENQRRTAAYNSQATIAYAIESFLAQKHPDKEMLVIEGMSDDGQDRQSFRSPDIRLLSEKQCCGRWR
jgi:hypothetical protein